MAQNQSDSSTTHDGSRKPFAPDSQEVSRIIDSTITVIATHSEQLQHRCLQEVERLQSIKDGMHTSAQYSIEVIEKYLYLLMGMATGGDQWTEQEIITALQSAQYCFGGVYEAMQ